MKETEDEAKRKSDAQKGRINNVTNILKNFTLDDDLTASTLTGMFGMFKDVEVTQDDDLFTIEVGGRSITIDIDADNLGNEQSKLSGFMYGLARSSGLTEEFNQ